MAPKNELLEKSISKRLEEERYKEPKERKEKKKFDIQWIILLSVLIGLALTLAQVIGAFG